MTNIAKMPKNLLAYPSQFNNAIWTKNNCSVVQDSGVLAPNRTPTADILHEDGTAASQHRLDYTVPIKYGIIYTVSIFQKSINRDWLFYQMVIDGVDANANFNSTTGAFGTQSVRVLDNNFEALQDGWYRHWFVFLSSADENATLRIFAANADNGVTFDGLDQDSLYIWGAMINEGWGPAPYQKTLHYSDINLLTAPNDFTSWTGAGGVSAVADQTIDPDGQLLADRIDDAGSSATGRMFQTFIETGDGTYCVMCRFKEGTTSACSLLVRTAVGAVRIQADYEWIAGVLTPKALDTGTAYGVVDIGGGWYLAWAVGAGILATDVNQVYVSPSEYSVMQAGNIFAWGARCFRGDNPGKIIAPEVPLT